MKIRITKTSSWDFEEVREVESLDCLSELAEEFHHHSFVVTLSSPYSYVDVDVEIYDDWRE